MRRVLYTAILFGVAGGACQSESPSEGRSSSGGQTSVGGVGAEHSGGTGGMGAGGWGNAGDGMAGFGGDTLPPEDCPVHEPSYCSLPFEPRQFGLVDDDQVLGMAADPCGRVYVTGLVGGRYGVENDGPVGDSVGIVDVHVRGASTERLEFDTGNTDAIHAATWSDEGLVWVGRTRGAISGAVNAGGFDLILGRLSSDNVLSALTQYGLDPSENPVRIAVLDDARLAVAGHHELYAPTNFVEAWEDPFLALFAPDGGITGPWHTRWVARAGTSEVDLGTGLVVVDEERLFSVGTTVEGASRGGFVNEFSDTGELLRHTLLIPGPQEHLAAIAQSNAGEIVVAGSTYKNLGGENAGGADAFVAGFDPSRGEMTWVVQIGSPDNDWVEDLAITPDGRFVIVGETYGGLSPDEPLRGASDAFLVLLSPTGEILSKRQFGSNSLDVAKRVVVDACGDLLVGGSTTGIMFDGATYGGRLDGFVIRVRLDP